MEKYALLGEHLAHSYSVIIQKKLFQLKNIDATYELLEIASSELKKVLDRLRNNEYAGFNVTIPYKVEVMKYLDEIDINAKEIGSVNTIKCIDGKLVGFNTDYFGFKLQLEYFDIKVKNKICYVLGTGGVSLAVSKVLVDLGAKVYKVSRNKDVENNILGYDDLNDVNKIDLIINSTPVGMYPHIDLSPIGEEIVSKADKVIDIIFNPEYTKLMSYAKEAYNGLFMLIAQANKAQEIWINKKININYSYMLDYVSEAINK